MVGADGLLITMLVTRFWICEGFTNMDSLVRSPVITLRVTTVCGDHPLRVASLCSYLLLGRPLRIIHYISAVGIVPNAEYISAVFPQYVGKPYFLKTLQIAEILQK